MLAAGSSSRFGANKLLQPFGDETVIARVLREVVASGCAPVVLVTGHDHERVESAAPADLRGRIMPAHNPRHAQGEMLSSVKVGIEALSPLPPGGAGGGLTAAALIIPGDMPLLTADVLQKVMTAYDPRECQIIAPMFNGQRGHPVLFGRSLWADILALAPDQNPRDVLRAHPGAIRQIELDTDAILVDVDTREKYEKAMLKDGRRKTALSSHLRSAVSRQKQP